MRKSKENWLEIGMKTLGEVGVNGLTIEGMASDMGLTKGSFYHHFRNRDDFKRQLVTYWAAQYLSTAADLPDDLGEPLELLDQIMRETFNLITEPEVAVRAWAQQDEWVGDYVQKVDAVRREFVSNVFRRVTGDEEKAQLMADMLFTVLIGSITMLPRMSSERVQDLYKEFKRLYGL